MEPQMAENYREYGACFTANISLISQQSQWFIIGLLTTAMEDIGLWNCSKTGDLNVWSNMPEIILSQSQIVVWGIDQASWPLQTAHNANQGQSVWA